jgi:hypothetical protein
MLAILAEAALRSFMLGSVVWLALKLLRVRNPHVHMTSWVLVLLASLAMPLLMQWTELTITVPAAPLAPVQDNLPGAESLLAEALRGPLSSEPALRSAADSAAHRTIDWWSVAVAVYGSVATLLLMRLALGCLLTWRLVRAAKAARSAGR